MLFESLVYEKLYKHLNSNYLLAKEQSSFRKLNSILKCLLKSTDEWYSALDSGQLVGLVLIDLKEGR